MDSVIVEESIQSYLSFRNRPYRDGKWLSKRPLDVFLLEEYLSRTRGYSRIRSVVVVRDVRDVITSVHPNVPNDYFIGYEKSYRVQNPGGPALLHAGIGEYFAAIKKLLQRKELSPVLVRYEDLVSTPTAVRQKLNKRFGIRISDSFENFHLHASTLPYRYEGSWQAKDKSRVRETSQIDPSRLGKWKAIEHKERIQQEFSEHPELFETLEFFGYESNHDWFQEYAREPSVGVP